MTLITSVLAPCQLRAAPSLALAGTAALLCCLSLATSCQDDDTTVPARAMLDDGPRPCLTDCTPRIGIVSAFGAEADLLLAETGDKQQYVINGKVFTSGVLRENPIVIVLSGVSVVNAAMTTQVMIDHFGVTHLIMSGIAGGLSPDNHVGDVLVPERWTMPLEAYFSDGSAVPAPCGSPGELGCLGLRLAEVMSGPGSDYSGTGIFMRDTEVLSAASAPTPEFKFAFEVDPEMLEVARAIAPDLQRCGETQPDVCVEGQPELKIVATGMSGSMFIANPDYRDYVYATIGAEVVDMETAALGQVAYANGIPYLAFRSLSDLAGGGEEGASVGAFFGSGLAEANEARVTLAFLEAWAARD
jgi:adenosylhomocysteine nucleosidase